MWKNKLRLAEGVSPKRATIYRLYVCAVQIVLVSIIICLQIGFCIVKERILQLNPFYGLNGPATRKD